MAKSQTIILYSVHTALPYNVSINVYTAQSCFIIITNPSASCILKKVIRIGIMPAYLFINCLSNIAVIIFIA